MYFATDVVGVTRCRWHFSSFPHLYDFTTSKIHCTEYQSSILSRVL